MADGSSLRKPNGDGDDCEIKVKTDTGNIISLKVKGSDTIGSIKLKIEAQKDIPFDEQELSLNEKLLENNNTLANLPINKHSNLTLTTIRKIEEVMEIFVETFAGKTISLLVTPKDTIYNVKMKIYRKDVIRSDGPPVVLIFNKMVLGESATLFDLNINTKSTLTLMRKSRGYKEIFNKIFVEILTKDQTITLEVKPTDTIRNIKAKIQDKVDIPHDEQELILNDMILHDRDILADCNTNINMGSTPTLSLMRISTGYMRIFIKTLTGKTITLKVKPSDTIYNLKSMISDKEQISTCQQRMIFNGMKLKDSPSLANYHIPNESIIHLILTLRAGMMKVLD